MASWWRRIKISAVFHPSSRRDRRSHAVARVIRRKTNRRHMIGDHHRRTAGRTTLLVTATDEILGTHRVVIREWLVRRAGCSGCEPGALETESFPDCSLPPLRQREIGRPPALVLRIERAEPVGVEVADHIADPVLAGERHLRDRGDVHALRGQQHRLRPPPGHYRPGSPAHDPHRAPALIIIDLTNPQAFRHRPSLGHQHLQAKRPARQASPGKRDLLRHYVPAAWRHHRSG
jgi:hypothetical protein